MSVTNYVIFIRTLILETEMLRGMNIGLGPTMAPALAQLVGAREDRAPPPSKEILREYLLPQLVLSGYLGYEENPRLPIPPPEVPEDDWLNKVKTYKIFI